MTAPAAIMATIAQPASRLATGDAASTLGGGGAMGGFEALLAMLAQSLQGGEAQGEATAQPSTEAPAGDDDLAALLAQAGGALWMAQALSQTNAAVQMNGNSVSNANTPADLFKARFKPLMAIMLKLANGAPSEHIRLDLTTNSIVNLSNQPSPF